MVCSLQGGLFVYERSPALGTPRPSPSSAQRWSSAATGTTEMSTAEAAGKHAAAQFSTNKLPLFGHTRKSPDAPALAPAVRPSENVTLAASAKPSNEPPPQMLPSTESAPAPATAARAPAEENVCTRGFLFWKCRSQRWWIIVGCILGAMCLASPFLCAFICWALALLVGYILWCYAAIKYWDDWVHPSIRQNPAKAQFLYSEQSLPVTSRYPS